VSSDLARLARQFAVSAEQMLNTTICTGVKITGGASNDPGMIYVGHGVSRVALETTAFPVQLGRRKPSCWLDVGFQVTRDTTERFLSVKQSHFGVFSAEDERRCLCRWDYEREKGDEHPEAHLQVYGKSAALASWTGQPHTRELSRLHLPAGGRRFRPIVEDIIQFLVAEGLAEPRDGWQDALAAHRREWERIQLKAAIRADPLTARDLLRELESAGQLAG
jgi:hypothetical protein